MKLTFKECFHYMRTREDWPWIRRMWRHWHRADLNAREWFRHEQDGTPRPAKVLMTTDVSRCVAATIAILLGRFDPDIECDCDNELAWKFLGYYHTDYGTGREWDSLVSEGFRYNIVSDGSL
jgi:hypothetical protein